MGLGRQLHQLLCTHYSTVSYTFHLQCRAPCRLTSTHNRKTGVLLLACACNKQPVQVSALPPYHMYKEPSRSWFRAGLNPSTHDQLRCPFPPAAARPTPVEAFLSLNSFMPLKKSYKLLVLPEGLVYNHKTRTTPLTPASYRIVTTMRQAEVKRKTGLPACRQKLTYVTI